MILAAAAYLGLFGYFCYQTRVLAPYSDLLDLFDFYFRSLERGDGLAYLLEPHGHIHRIPWLRLQVAIDAWLGGGGLVFVVPAVIGLGAIAWLLARQAAAAAPGALGLVMAALALMVVLSSANAADVSVPANTSYTQTVVFAVLAILLAHPASGASRRKIVLLRAGALALAAAAALGNAVGLVIWPALAFAAWRAGPAERGWLVAVIVAGAGFVAAYAWGLDSAPARPEITARSALRMADYAIAFMGLPWIRASDLAGRVIGLALLAAAGLALFRSGGPAAMRPEKIGMSLVVFSLGAAGMAALGRGGAPGEIDIPVRYTLLLAPLHIGLLILAGPSLEKIALAFPRASRIALPLAAALLLVQQVLVGQAAARAAANTRSAIALFEAGDRSPPVAALVHPDLDRAARIRAEIAARSLYRR